MSDTLTLRIETVTGNVTISGDSEAVMDVVCNAIRGRAAIHREFFDPEAYDPDESKKQMDLLDKILTDHNFFRDMSIAEINRLLLEDLD